MIRIQSDLELGDVSSITKEDPLVPLSLNGSDTEMDEGTHKQEDDGLNKESLQNKDAIDFSQLWEEFSIQTLWHGRDRGEMKKTAAKNLLLGFIPTLSDVFSDIKVFFDYLYGTIYTKTVDTINHEYVNSTTCTLNYRTTVDSWTADNWKEESVKYTFSCFERDPGFAWATFVFIFILPGFSLFCPFVLNLTRKLWTRDSENERRQQTCMVWLKVCLFLFYVFLCFPIIVVSYPVVVLLWKMISIFHNGKQFKKISTKMALSEGTCEAAPQLCAQLFIIFSRGDRFPTPFQWFSLVSSAITFNLPQIEDFNATKPPPDGIKEEIMRILTYLPLFISTVLFRIMTIAIISVLLRYYAIGFYGAVVVALLILRLLVPSTTYLLRNSWSAAFTITNLPQDVLTHRKTKIFCNNIFQKTHVLTDVVQFYTKEEKEKAIHRYLQFHMLFWFVINYVSLICILILANYSEVTIDGNTWSSLPMIANISFLNGVIISTLVCGAISMVLFYLQVETKWKKKLKKKLAVSDHHKNCVNNITLFDNKMTDNDIVSIIEDLLSKVVDSSPNQQKI